MSPLAKEEAAARKQNRENRAAKIRADFGERRGAHGAVVAIVIIITFFVVTIFGSTIGFFCACPQATNYAAAIEFRRRRSDPIPHLNALTPELAYFTYQMCHLVTKDAHSLSKRDDLLLPQ